MIPQAQIDEWLWMAGLGPKPAGMEERRARSVSSLDGMTQGTKLAPTKPDEEEDEEGTSLEFGSLLRNTFPSV